MRIYFDTNVYDFIHNTGESDEINAFLVNKSIELIASGDNLFEFLDIADQDQCKGRMLTLSKTATNFEKAPISYHQAMELLCEIKRIKPEWLRNPPSEKLLRRRNDCLSNHKCYGINLIEVCTRRTRRLIKDIK